jgi:hypothetical protein
MADAAKALPTQSWHDRLPGRVLEHVEGLGLTVHQVQLALWGFARALDALPLPAVEREGLAAQLAALHDLAATATSEHDFLTFSLRWPGAAAADSGEAG